MFLSNDKETQLLACDLIVTHPNFEKIKNKELKKTFLALEDSFYQVKQVKVPIIKIIQSVKSVRTNYDESRDFFNSDDIEQILQLL